MSPDAALLSIVIAMFAVSMGFTAALEYVGRRRLQKLLRRPCAGLRWHRAFPGVDHAAMRQFLALFSGCFGLRPDEGCRFRPDDRVMDVYSARYLPHFTIDDGLEIESFAEEFERTYSLSLEKIWRDDISLGEIFKYTVR